MLILLVSSLVLTSKIGGAAERCERPAAPIHTQAIGGRPAMAVSHSTDSLVQRFFARVQVNQGSGCWLWRGAMMTTGYPVMSLGARRKKMLAHRFAYEQLRGPIPAGLVLDHLCRTPACVNPDHLEAVRQRENVLRGNGIPAHRARQTHCAYGHAFTPENTWARRGCRECRTCVRARKTAARRAFAAAHGYPMPTRIRPREMAALLVRDKRCYLCGAPNAPATNSLDHVTPLSKGGRHSFENFRIVHLECNLRKRDRLVLLPFETIT